MPVEIREIVIRAIATPERPAPAESPPSVTALDREELIAACVREVMRIQKQEKER